MTQQVGIAWAKSKSTVLGSALAAVGGTVATAFGFVYFDSTQVASTMVLVELGLTVFGIMFAAGFIVLRRGAGNRASAGFLGFAIAALMLVVASTLLDPYQAGNSVAAGLDALVVLVGSTAALAGGIFLFSPLRFLPGRPGLGKATAYVLLVGGILQIIAGIPDSIGMVLNSAGLQNFASPFYGIAGLFFTVAGPILLYLAVRKLNRPVIGLEQNLAEQKQILT